MSTREPERGDCGFFTELGLGTSYLEHILSEREQPDHQPSTLDVLVDHETSPPTITFVPEDIETEDELVTTWITAEVGCGAIKDLEAWQ